MSWQVSILDGVRNAYKSSGHMARGAFWTFAPFGLFLPLIYGLQVNWLQVHFWVGMMHLSITFILSLPLLNALSRRLQDAGFDGSQAYLPFAPFALLWFGYQGVLWGGAMIAMAGGFILTFILWTIALLVLVPLHIVMLIASIFIIANLIGQALVATDPNRPAPNLHEVLQ